MREEALFITEEKDEVQSFKDHFQKIIETLKIDRAILSDLSDDPVLNYIEKFSHHASVLKIKETRHSFGCFSNKLVTIENICKEILALEASKDTQSNGMPTKIIKNNSKIFSKVFQITLNNIIETSTFPEQLKYADVKQVFFKKKCKLTTIDQWVFFLICLKFMKGSSTSNCRNIFGHCYLNINVVSRKVIV